MRGVKRNRGIGAVVEGLEGRRLFAAGYGHWVGPNDTIIDFNGGAVRWAPNLHVGYTWLVVSGSNDADTIKVTPAGNSGRDWLVEINGQSQVFSDPAGQRAHGVEIYGYGGDDHLELNITDANLDTFLLWTEVSGGAGNDTLVGSDLDSHWTFDDLDGDWGNDTLIGRDGKDQLDGGDGDDILWGDEVDQPGQPLDILNGGEGLDTIAGITETPPPPPPPFLGTTAVIDGVTIEFTEGSWENMIVVTGTDGNDALTVSHDADNPDVWVITINGVDHALGGPPGYTVHAIQVNGLGGNDQLQAVLSTDSDVDKNYEYWDCILDGGDGDDTLTGGSTPFAWGRGDTLLGGNGNDVLLGLDGWDFLYGGAGDDDVDGGLGRDRVYGNDGSGLAPQPGDVVNGGADTDDDWIEGVFETIPGDWEFAMQGLTVRYREFKHGGYIDVLGTDAGDDVINVHVDTMNPHSLRLDINGAMTWVHNESLHPVLHLNLYGGRGYDRIEVNLTDAQLAQFGIVEIAVSLHDGLPVMGPLDPHDYAGWLMENGAEAGAQASASSGALAANMPAPSSTWADENVDDDDRDEAHVAELLA